MVYRPTYTKQTQIKKINYNFPLQQDTRTKIRRPDVIVFKVKWGDKDGSYGEQYWDLNHGGADESAYDNVRLRDRIDFFPHVCICKAVIM